MPYILHGPCINRAFLSLQVERYSKLHKYSSLEVRLFVIYRIEQWAYR
jgi:hypothetical protein